VVLFRTRLQLKGEKDALGTTLRVTIFIEMTEYTGWSKLIVGYLKGRKYIKNKRQSVIYG